MKLRTKLLLIVVGAILLVSAPIVYLSYTQTLDKSIRMQEETFARTVATVTESLTSNYLRLLADKVDHIIAAKQALDKMINPLAQAVRHVHPNYTRDFIEQCEDTVERSGVHFALYDPAGEPLVGDPLISAAVAPGSVDFLSQPVSSYLHRDASASKATRFAIVNVSAQGFSRAPLILAFRPVSEQVTMVLAQPMAGEFASIKWIEDRLLESIRGRLEHIVSDVAVSAHLTTASGLSLASNATPYNLLDIPEDACTKAREKTWDSGYSNRGKEPVLYFIGYFKPMDWFVVMTTPYEALVKPARAFSNELLAIVASLLAVSSLLALWVVARLIAPLRLLLARARLISSTDFANEEGRGTLLRLADGLPEHRTDEVGELAGAFAHMLRELHSNIRNLMASTAKTERLVGELEAARQIQQGMLPVWQDSATSLGCDLAASLQPAKEVGGDFYDFMRTPDGRTAVVIGDVSDKGVSAALFMSMAVTVVRESLSRGCSAAETMARVNERLAANNPQCMFVTLFIGLLDTATGRFEYANGAHCLPLVAGGGKVRELEGLSGPLVGALPGVAFKAFETTLKVGETCLLYTDGVSEAMDEDKHMFGAAAAARVLASGEGLGCEHVIELVNEAVTQHRGKALQSDDITMLCFARMGLTCQWPKRAG